jgi:hypothetical protein
MDNKLFFTFVAAASLIAGAGCNKSGKLNTPSEFKTPTGPVELKVKWPVGERVVQDLDMKQVVDINVPGRPDPMKQNTAMGQKYALTVLKQDAEGGHEVELEFLSARMKTEMNGKTQVDYDSDRPDTEKKKNPVSSVYNKVVGSKIKFFLDSSNNVVRLEGMDELLNRLSTSSQDPSATSLKATFNETYFKQMMSANRFLPPKAVQPGDTWPVSTEFPLTGMGTMTVTYTITLRGWEMHGKRNCARLELDGSIKLKPDATPAPGGLNLSIPDGNTTGVSWFDPELGIVIDSQMNQDMTIVMSLPGSPRPRPGSTAKGMMMTNQLNQVLNIKLDSVK